jgi:putative hydrolase of HD superfamily
MTLPLQSLFFQEKGFSQKGGLCLPKEIGFGKAEVGGSNPPGPIMNEERLIDFFQEVSRLKEIQRAGWIIDGVKEPESVAEHIFMTAFMTMSLGQGRNDINLLKAVKMALVHDIMESRTGDLVLPHKKYRGRPLENSIPHEQKHEIEKKGMTELASILGKEGLEYLSLWEELEEGKTPEAVFVKQVDWLQLGFQAFEYEKRNNHKRGLKNLEHYFWFCRYHINDPQLKSVLDKIMARRKKE